MGPFSPLFAVRAATMPNFQVLMVGYLKIAPRVRRYYAHTTHFRVAVAQS